MPVAMPTRQRLYSQLEDLDILLKELLEKVNRRPRYDDIEHIIFSLLDKDKELKATLQIASEQMVVQLKIEKLRADCEKSDLQINLCQHQLKKCELLLCTALYYSRQKLDSMVKAVKNPTDVEELIKYAHRISCTYGALAPDNWTPGDPRRPYPNKEEIRRGYLGHLDDSGKFLPSLKEFIVSCRPTFYTTPSSIINTPAPIESTPSQNVLLSSTQTHNQTSVSSESIGNSSAYSPNMGIAGADITPSPSGMVPSNGSSSNWIEPQQQYRHQHPTLSLTAILSSGSGSNSRPFRSGGLPESPNANIWQQQQLHALPAVLSNTPPQRKRTHADDMRMYSDNSDEDAVGDGLEF